MPLGSELYGVADEVHDNVDGVRVNYPARAAQPLTSQVTTPKIEMLTNLVEFLSPRCQYVRNEQTGSGVPLSEVAKQ
jgi:hypothetical protein